MYPVLIIRIKKSISRREFKIFLSGISVHRVISCHKFKLFMCLLLFTVLNLRVSFWYKDSSTIYDINEQDGDWVNPSFFNALLTILIFTYFVLILRSIYKFYCTGIVSLILTCKILFTCPSIKR